MRTWNFSTKNLDPERKYEAWKEALYRLHLPVGEIGAGEEFFGHISCLTSPLGMEFARVSSAAQEISGDFPKQASAIWLSLLVKGHAILIDSRGQTELMPGDILYGATGMPARLKFVTPFTQLFVKIPHLAISPRLLAPLSLSLGHLRGGFGINHILSHQLVALSDALDDLRSDELRPIELSLTEFMLTCISATGSSALVGCGNKVRSMQLHGICQTIETLLGDSKLNPEMVSDLHGVSLRYLQKVFTQNNDTFTNYVRTRRLARCKADLTSPIYAQMSVTEICFRWGFNSSAHFSRSFKAEVGMSPREYRRENRSS